MEKVTINGKEYQIDIDKCKEQGLLVEENWYPKNWNEYIRLMHPNALCGYEDNYTIGSHLTLKEYDASNALLKLIVLRDWWWDNMCDGWRPDWEISRCYFCIYNYANNIIRNTIERNHYILAFPTEIIRNRFHNAYKDLIEEAKMFL